jgi:hypothetical protein
MDRERAQASDLAVSLNMRMLPLVVFIAFAPVAQLANGQEQV